MRIKIQIICLIFLAGYGCRPILLKYYGINRPKQKTDKEITSTIKLWLNKDEPYINYQVCKFNPKYLDLFDSTVVSNKVQLSAHQQPIHVLMFNDSNYLVCMTANCYAAPKGRNLVWNTASFIDSFPNKSRVKIHNKFVKESLDSFLIPISKHNKFSENNSICKYNLYIIWSYVILRQSKNLISNDIKRLLDNIKPAIVNVTFINIDENYL